MQQNTLTREQWDTFVAANSEDGGVLQSWEWGEFQESLGRRIFRLTNGEQQIEMACLLVEHRLPFGLRYLYAPRGPVMNAECRMQNSEFLNELIHFAREQRVAFLRIEPPYYHETWNVNHETLRKIVSIQPQQTLRVDLTKSTDDILAAMHEKTRYNVRLAKKRGVHVAEENDVEEFWKLLKTTTERDGFHMHPRIHYEKILSTLDSKLFFAEYNGQPIATALVAFFGTTAYYLHGASANEHRDVMAPYALHWTVIQEAKRRGCTSYDLWGVDEKRWPGVTRFKKGFAPHTPFITYLGTFDIPIRKGLYWLYQMAHRL